MIRMRPLPVPASVATMFSGRPSASAFTVSMLMPSTLRRGTSTAATLRPPSTSPVPLSMLTTCSSSLSCPARAASAAAQTLASLCGLPAPSAGPAAASASIAKPKTIRRISRSPKLRHFDQTVAGVSRAPAIAAPHRTHERRLAPTWS